MNKTTEALKLAEEALHAELEAINSDEFDAAADKCYEALAAIREALAEQSLGEYHGKLMREVCNKVITKTLAEPVKQEPVAWMVTSEGLDGTPKTYPLTGRYKDVRDMCDFGDPLPLYAAPVSAKREWVDLTDDDILAIAIQYDAEEGISDVEYGNRVIAAFKEKNK